MKVKELIEQLKLQDPEKEVMIQQGEEYDYMIVYSVKPMSVMDFESVITEEDDDPEIDVVVINYQ